jgi:hypothetical protein
MQERGRFFEGDEDGLTRHGEDLDSYSANG